MGMFLHVFEQNWKDQTICYLMKKNQAQFDPFLAELEQFKDPVKGP